MHGSIPKVIYHRIFGEYIFQLAINGIWKYIFRKFLVIGKILSFTNFPWKYRFQYIVFSQNLKLIYIEDFFFVERIANQQYLLKEGEPLLL